MSEYTLLYDARLIPFWTWNEVFPLFFPAILGAIIHLRSDERPLQRKAARWLAVGGTGLMVLFTGVQFAVHRQLGARLDDGNYEHVDGMIEWFQPGGFDGHRRESFTVSGHTYSFSAAASVAGYHAVQGEAGPIHNGARVRIADVNGSIARFEVAP
jgi:hypothetical protein